jgi:hypothetical protein
VSNSTVDADLPVCQFVFRTTCRGIVAAPCICIEILLCACAAGSTAQRFHAQVAQKRTDFEKMHKALTSTEKLRYHRPMVFIGEITALGPMYQRACKEAVNESVDFAISRLVFGKFSGTALHTGYINCTTQPLPSPPFTVHAPVIVYCEQRPDLICLNPVPLTEKRQRTVEAWNFSHPPEDWAARRGYPVRNWRNIPIRSLTGLLCLELESGVMASHASPPPWYASTLSWNLRAQVV